MRIAFHIIRPVVWLICALAPLSTPGYLVRASSPNSTLSQDSSYESSLDESGSSEWRPRRVTYRDSLRVLRAEAGEGGLPVDCCPSVLEMVEPRGGIDLNGNIVQLYADGENKQRFYELSCREGVEEQPCRFMDHRLRNQSKCVQKFSWTYAIVRTRKDQPHRHNKSNHLSKIAGEGSEWSLDYIKVRSGCSCEVIPRPEQRRKRRKGATASARPRTRSRQPP